jgi:hypothetical protein
MKFELGERVRVKSTGKVAKIKGYRIDAYYLQGNERHLVQYNLDYGTYYDNWLKEDMIEKFNTTYEFSKKFEAALADLMIDINLANKNLHMVKNFFDIKQSLNG